MCVYSRFRPYPTICSVSSVTPLYHKEILRKTELTIYRSTLSYITEQNIYARILVGQVKTIAYEYFLQAFSKYKLYLTICQYLCSGFIIHNITPHTAKQNGNIKTQTSLS